MRRCPGRDLIERKPVIRRETDPELANRIMNAAEVRPFFNAEPIDLSPVFWGGRNEGRRFYVLSNGEDAIGLFEGTVEGVYQSHTAFASTCRGRRAIDTAREMVEWMFEHGANIVWGATPRNNRPARWFNRQIGGKIIGGDDEAEVFEIRKAA